MKKIIFSWMIGLVALLLFQCTHTVSKKEKTEDYPVLETMGYYQRFSHKLWLAGRNSNWDLAHFYTHELEEVTAHLMEGEVIHDDYNLSNLSASMLLPKIEKVEEAVRKKDQVLFLENYELMISSCNLCHQATHHAFIKITVPTDSTVWNQDFGI